MDTYCPTCDEATEDCQCCPECHEHPEECQCDPHCPECEEHPAECVCDEPEPECDGYGGTGYDTPFGNTGAGSCPGCVGCRG